MDQKTKVTIFLQVDRERMRKKLEPKKLDYTWKFDKENYKLKKVSIIPEQLSLL